LAIEKLAGRGQSQEMLLRILQAKLSERVSTYSIQMVRSRRLFVTYDANKDMLLDEGEFRLLLEHLNIQFDDIQVTALFAFLDTNDDGYGFPSFFYLCRYLILTHFLTNYLRLNLDLWTGRILQTIQWCKTHKAQRL
jgi:hypothetical protein